MDDIDELFEADAAMMCLGGGSAERLAWLGEASGGMGPAALFDAARLGRMPADVSVIGRPGEALADLMEGDYVVTRVFGEGPIGSVRVADQNDPTEVWPGERLPADTAVLRLETCGCATCRSRG
jgi:hypothetical protein